MNVSRFVIDSVDEIDKISKIYGNDAEIIVRLNVNNHHCDINLNEKYGINESEVPSIIEHIHYRKLNMIGFCFHVGSRNYNESIYTEMIEKCLNYQELMNEYNFKIKLIDIGGGFITTNDDKMDRVFESIREFIEQIKEPIEWITEPGRYMVDDSIDNHCEIIGKRSREERIDYVLDDSAYMNFNHILYDHRKIKESEIELNIQISLDKAINWCHSRLWGQTCDSHDVILEEIRLPELKIGDVIVFKLSGAYTLFGGGNEFNGFKQKRIELIE
jgi:ornithine decarboxylase